MPSGRRWPVRSYDGVDAALQYKRRAVKRLVIAAACLLTAVFFQTALTGYSFMALALLLLTLLLTAYALADWLFAKRPTAAKRLRSTITALLCLGLAALAAVECPIVLAARGSAAEVDYIIVLGAGVNGKEPSVSLRDRLEAALAYLNAYPESRAILSGGRGAGEAVSEAACMYAWLTERGIHKARLLQEDQARNTEENIRFSREMLPEGVRVGILTSDYHLYRAKMHAQKLGIQAVGIPARSSLPVLALNYYFREAFAVAQLWLLGWT